MSDIVVIAQNAGGNGHGGPGCCGCLFWLLVVFIIMSCLAGGIGR